MLDLDTINSITTIDPTINTALIDQAIYKIIRLLRMNSVFIGTEHRDIGPIEKQVLDVKYLNHTLPITFEYDNSFQFITIVYNSQDLTKNYLKVFICINDNPTIKYIENDRSGAVPSYADDKIFLKPGEYLVNLTHRLLSFMGFKRCRLDDDSHLNGLDSKGTTMHTKLWLYYLIIKRKSWYAKFGYQPANITTTEYQLLITDVRSIDLQEVVSCLTKLLTAPNKEYLDTFLVETSQSVVNLVSAYKGNLYEYTVSHTLEEFTKLTNNLTQSIYRTNILIETNGQYLTLEFPWFRKFINLFVANVLQVNNDIAAIRIE